MAFIRRVYAILACQLLFTAALSVVMSQPSVIEWTRANSWFFWIPMIGSFASLFALMWKAQTFPLNLVILAIFTLFEGLTVGTIVSFYESRIVIQGNLPSLIMAASKEMFI
jgi:FtsH-binding integral membrane protein